MSIFEWFFERKTPNPVGSIEFTKPPKNQDPINWPALIIGLSLLLGLIYFLILGYVNETYSMEQILLRVLLLTVYSIWGYLMSIEPNYSNTGWLGVFDNPFRYTDDINRFLIFLHIFFYPGKIMCMGLVELWRLL